MPILLPDLFSHEMEVFGNNYILSNYKVINLTLWKCGRTDLNLRAEKWLLLFKFLIRKTLEFYVIF